MFFILLHLPNMNHIIHHDISLFLYSISIQYKIDLDLLRKRYLPTINIEKKFKIKRNSPKKPRKPHTLFPSHHRCLARTWANGSVSFNSNTHSWIYGAQCSHLKHGSSNYCRIHLATIKRHSSLPHGDFDKPPPHTHYDKYKKKIMEQ